MRRYRKQFVVMLLIVVVAVVTLIRGRHGSVLTRADDYPTADLLITPGEPMYTVDLTEEATRYPMPVRLSPAAPGTPEPYVPEPAEPTWWQLPPTPGPSPSD